MKVHHLNCATMCPRSARLSNGEGGWLEPGHIPAHCLLIETGNSLVLVDTGLGTGDFPDPRKLGRIFKSAFCPQLDPAETAIAQLKALGFDPADVRHIVPTHLDVDHAGGLTDFPGAAVQVFRTEHEAAMKPSWRERERYRRHQLPADLDWRPHDVGGDTWFGFESVRAVPDAEDEILLIPLPGHSRGHCGVAVREQDGWLLHCGDAYFHEGELADPRTGPAGLRVFENINSFDNRKRRHNEGRLRDLRRDHGSEVRTFCAHDPAELERFVAAG